MFDFVHSEQEEGWREVGFANATHFSPSRSQREHGNGMTSPSDRISATVRERNSRGEARLDLEDRDLEAALAMMSLAMGNQIETEDTTPLINDLEMQEVFEDEDGEEGAGVTDALSTMLRLLGEESDAARWLIEARSRMEPIEPCDEQW